MKNITGITGRISRWTVDDDLDFGYTMSSEPLNITEPYVYNYEQFSQVSMANSPTKLVGSAMDLNVPQKLFSMKIRVQKIRRFIILKQNCQYLHSL